MFTSTEVEDACMPEKLIQRKPNDRTNKSWLPAFVVEASKEDGGRYPASTIIYYYPTARWSMAS